MPFSTAAVPLQRVAGGSRRQVVAGGMMYDVRKRYTQPGNLAVIDAYWKARKKRLEKKLEEYQRTGWKTGGFTVNNCDALRRRLYKNTKYCEQSGSPTSSQPEGEMRQLNSKYNVLPGIGGEDPNTLHEIHSEVTYDDILRRNGASVKYMRRFNNEKEKITLNNRSFEAKSKVDSMENFHHVPGGGSVTIINKPLDLSEVKSKVGSLDNYQRKPGGGKKKVHHYELHWNVKSQVGSLENIDHTPGGGDIYIADQKIQWNAQAKVGSLDNIGHVPTRSYRTWQEYISPMRKRLLQRSDNVWTQGYEQEVIQDHRSIHPLPSKLTHQTRHR